MNSALHRSDDYRENDFVTCWLCHGMGFTIDHSDSQEISEEVECDKCEGTGEIELTNEDQDEKDFENEYEW